MPPNPKIVFKVGDIVNVSDRYVPIKSLALYTTKQTAAKVLNVYKKKTRFDYHKRYFYQVATDYGDFLVPNSGVKPIKGVDYGV